MSASSSSPPAMSSTDTSDTTAGDPGDMIDTTDFNFNYLFLLIAVLFVIGILITVWFSRRKRRKNAEMRHNSLNALERDVENLAVSTRSYGAWRYRLGNGGAHRAEEGLDERGEAPPPYNPDDKPPPPEAVTVSVENLIASPSGTEAAQPHALAQTPPEYHNSQGTYVRPPPAVAVTAPSDVMSEVDEDMYRNAASRMRPDYRSSMSPRRS